MDKLIHLNFIKEIPLKMNKKIEKSAVPLKMARTKKLNKKIEIAFNFIKEPL